MPSLWCLRYVSTFKILVTQNLKLKFQNKIVKYTLCIAKNYEISLLFV
jgi:hypothetical protein